MKLPVSVSVYLSCQINLISHTYECLHNYKHSYVCNKLEERKKYLGLTSKYLIGNHTQT